MIRYALCCHDCEAEFEAWFASSAAWDDQSSRGLVTCPACDSTHVTKQIMAPAVAGTKRGGAPKSMEEAARAVLAKARDHVAKTFDYVGDDFASEARAMHYGDIDERPIWGKATLQEAKSLKDEGVPASPLPEPLAPETPPTPKDKIN